jgi:hypothetical protein
MNVLADNRWLAVGIVACCLLILAGCTGVDPGAPKLTTAQGQPTAARTAETTDPGAVYTQLTPAASLAAAAEQLAGVLGVETATIVVQAQSSSCCAADPRNPASQEYEELSLAEAVARDGEFSVLWLFVQDLSCYYNVVDGTLQPQSCSRVFR